LILLSAPERYRIGLIARARIEQHFSIGQIAAQYGTVYRNLVESTAAKIAL
jgi:hypothetical protein